MMVLGQNSCPDRLTFASIQSAIKKSRGTASALLLFSYLFNHLFIYIFCTFESEKLLDIFVFGYYFEFILNEPS